MHYTKFYECYCSEDKKHCECQKFEKEVNALSAPEYNDI